MRKKNSFENQLVCERKLGYSSFGVKFRFTYPAITPFLVAVKRPQFEHSYSFIKSPVCESSYSE